MMSPSEPLELLRSLGALAGAALVTALWQGVALATAAWVCLRLVQRTTAALRFGLWAGVLLLVCMLPFMEGVSLPASGDPLMRVDPRWSLLLAAAWVALSLARAVQLFWQGLRLRELGREATPVVPDPGVAALLAESTGRVDVCTSERVERPGVIGFFRPRILIPTWLYTQLTAPELEQIVLHELEHLRRGDDWLNLLQKIVLVVFPLNPVLHWIERRLCLERELACDEGVVRRTRAPRLYATCLTRLAEHGLDRRAISLALSVMERQSELGRRVAGVLHTPRALSARYRLAVIGTIAAVLLGGSAELARCPQLISFAVMPMVASYPQKASPEGWVGQAGANRVVYTDTATARFVKASFVKVREPVHRKVKAHRTQRAGAPPERAQVGHVLPSTNMLAALPEEDTVAPLPVATPAMITPMLVRYTLVRVDGGWLLLQL